MEGDIKKIETKDVPSFDILVAGFPCQSFSIAGNQGGFKDERGLIFFEIIRFLKAKKPRAFFLENVRNLINHDEGNTFETMLKLLEECGY
jgi:DNA (cytosine-5)-methyltransferase 1